MGCHTEYKKLINNNQEEIIAKVRNIISTSNFYSWFEFDCLKDLFESDQEQIQEIADYVYEYLDGLTCVKDVYGIYESDNIYNIDEPRIGNYPDTIITSADEMFKAMEKGLTGWEGNHCNFYWDKERDTQIRKNIIDFFKTHPDGIIEFV